MTFLVEIRNGQQYDKFEKWVACACKTQDDAFRAVQVFNEWAEKIGPEYEAYMKAWVEKNPPPTFPDNESDSSISDKNEELRDAWEEKRCEEIDRIWKTIGPPPIWGKVWVPDRIDDIERHSARWFQVPEWEELPRCRICNHGLLHSPEGADPICVLCAADERARNSPLQKHQTCHYCGLRHYKVEAGGIYHCPNRLCPGCGAARSREKMRLKSFKECEGNKYTLDPEELIHYVANHPHEDPKVHEKEKECVPKWLTREKPE
jgi:hypothetical protein